MEDNHVDYETIPVASMDEEGVASMENEEEDAENELELISVPEEKKTERHPKSKGGKKSGDSKVSSSKPKGLRLPLMKQKLDFVYTRADCHQADLAKLTGINHKILFKIKHGLLAVSPRNVAALARCFEISSSELASDTMNEFKKAFNAVHPSKNPKEPATLYALSEDEKDRVAWKWMIPEKYRMDSLPEPYQKEIQDSVWMKGQLGTPDSQEEGQPKEGEDAAGQMKEELPGETKAGETAEGPKKEESVSAPKDDGTDTEQNGPDYVSACATSSSGIDPRNDYLVVPFKCGGGILPVSSLEDWLESKNLNPSALMVCRIAVKKDSKKGIEGAYVLTDTQDKQPAHEELFVVGNDGNVFLCKLIMKKGKVAFLKTDTSNIIPDWPTFNIIGRPVMYLGEIQD